MLWLPTLKLDVEKVAVVVPPLVVGHSLLCDLELLCPGLIALALLRYVSHTAS